MSLGSSPDYGLESGGNGRSPEAQAKIEELRAKRQSGELRPFESDWLRVIELYPRLSLRAAFNEAKTQFKVRHGGVCYAEYPLREDN